MKFRGGTVEKGDIEFAVVQVDKDTFNVPGRARDTVETLKRVFPDMSIVLMTRDERGIPTFYGRPDIVNGLGDAALRDVEWQNYVLE